MNGGIAAAASSRGGHFDWIVKALCRARDRYVSSMIGCAGRFSYRGAVGYPVGAAVGMPRSYSFQGSRASSSSEDDLRELIRAASQGAMGSLNLVPRSQSVGMGRIDEDKPCDFGESAMARPLYPRSRSCAVSKRKVGVMS